MARNDKEKRATEVYVKTKGLADKNATVQAVSGVFGLGVNLAVDLAALPFYVNLWNEIRSIYGRGSITAEAATAYLKPNIGFLIQDLVFDKALGSIPIIGIPFNYMCAKALTWRLGAWFGVLSALGEEKVPGPTLTRSTMQLVSEFFPLNRSLLSFEEPDVHKFVAFVAGLDGLTHEESERRALKALEALKGLDDE